MSLLSGNNKQICPACGAAGSGNYCSNCGQAYVIKRITLRGLLYDIFNLFTNINKGFLYTLKQLIVAPGQMQWNYIHHERARHQSPFSMFFICATVAALVRYWIYGYFEQDIVSNGLSESTFFHEYWVFVHIAMMPLNILITYLIFYNSKYNYAETGVLLLYTFSFFFLVASLSSLLKFIWMHIDTGWIELPIFLVYSAITFVKFFKEQKTFITVLKSIIVVISIFFMAQLAEDWAIQWFSE